MNDLVPTASGNFVTAPGSSFDPDAVAYFAALTSAGVAPSSSEMAAANTFIVGSKAAGLWANWIRVYLDSPSSFAGALLCAKTLIPRTAVNMTSADWSSAGFVYDGISKYLLCDVALSTFGLATVSFAASSYSINVTTNAKVLMGCEHSDGANQFFITGYEGQQ